MNWWRLVPMSLYGLPLSAPASLPRLPNATVLKDWSSTVNRYVGPNNNAPLELPNGDVLFGTATEVDMSHMYGHIENAPFGNYDGKNPSAGNWQYRPISGGPSISDGASNEKAAAGKSATFSVNAFGSGSLYYQWQRNTGVACGRMWAEGPAMLRSRRKKRWPAGRNLELNLNRLFDSDGLSDFFDTVSMNFDNPVDIDTITPLVYIYVGPLATRPSAHWRNNMRHAKLRIFNITAAALLLMLCVCDFSDIFDNSTGPNAALSEAEVVAGLKAALEVGIDTAKSNVARVGGYYLNDAIKILLPEDVGNALQFAENLENKVSSLSPIIKAGMTLFDFTVFNDMRDTLVFAVNRAAEEAAPRSVSIFKNAITGITIRDGLGILQGDSTAATAYLKDTTYAPLTDVYSPFVDSALDLVGANQLWQYMATNYNSLVSYYHAIPSIALSAMNMSMEPETLTTELGTYTTGKALDGLFYMVGLEETRIRRDPVARVRDILEDVFGWLDRQ
ncbi:MAG: DUF4197 family protein [Chitinivibrionales bacterium]|nr:DUF4197 family protein [Chitinivibrionales bacterium]